MRSSVIIASALLALSGCKSTSGTTAAKEDLALAPKQTDIVLMANVARMRGTAMWKKLIDARDGNPQSKKDYQEFVQKSGLDPFQHIDSVFLAVPQGGGDTKEFVAVVRGKLDEQKLIAYAREQAKKEGREVKTTEYGGKKIYSDSQKGEAFAAFLDAKTAVIGGKEWIKKSIDLAAGKGESAKLNGELAGLMKRAKTSDAVWGAGIVPQSARDNFKNDPRLQAAATMKDIFGSVDFASGIVADLNIDTAGEPDAKQLVSTVSQQLAEVKKSPQLMMMGLGQFLDGIKVDNKGATFRLALNYTQQQVDDLIGRVQGLLKSFGGALGAGAAPAVPPN
jgi:hypothetical protein